MRIIINIDIKEINKIPITESILNDKKTKKALSIFCERLKKFFSDYLKTNKINSVVTYEIQEKEKKENDDN